jgi:hypothetical protein
MQTLAERMEHVAAVAERVGVTRLAREAGLPLSTVRSFRNRGWGLKSIPNAEALIAAAERLEVEGETATTSNAA